jgi:hypothetical protein
MAVVLLSVTKPMPQHVGAWIPMKYTVVDIWQYGNMAWFNQTWELMELSTHPLPPTTFTTFGILLRQVFWRFIVFNAGHAAQTRKDQPVPNETLLAW